MFGLAQQGGKEGLRLRFITTLCSQNSHPSDSAVHSKIPWDQSCWQSFPMLCNTPPSSTAPSPCTLVITRPPYIPAHTEGGEAQLRSHPPPPPPDTACATSQQPDLVRAKQLGDQGTQTLWRYRMRRAARRLHCGGCPSWTARRWAKIFALVGFILWLSDKGSGTKASLLPPSHSPPPPAAQSHCAL